MAKTYKPIFTQAVKHYNVALSAANTNQDGTGTLVTVCAGVGTDGSIIRKITMKARGVTTGGMIRLFIDDGTTKSLWKEFIVTAITPAATVKSWEDELYLPEGKYLSASTVSLKASTHNAESFSVIADVEDYA